MTTKVFPHPHIINCVLDRALVTDAVEIAKMQCKSYKRDYIKPKLWKKYIEQEGQFVFVMRQFNEGPVITVLRCSVLPEYFLINNLIVHKDFKRLGLGTFFIGLIEQNCLKYKKAIVCHLREHNLDAQLFLKSNKFLCKDQKKNFYTNPEEDQYEFRKELADVESN